MIIENEIKLDFNDVLLRPKRSTLRSRENVSLARELVFKHSRQKWCGTPIIASNMDTVGTFEMAKALSRLSMTTVLHKFYTAEDWKNFSPASEGVYPWYIVPSFGANDEDIDKLKKILAVRPEIKMICIDVANGYGEYLPDFIKRVRERFEELTIISGNVVTAEMTEQLILSGADVVKVGLGSGSVCTTRIQTGVGYPQLSAVVECADAAHGLNGQIVSDGGCTCPGDVVKAFGAGADFVMLGGMLAGHKESGGELIAANPSTGDVVFLTNESVDSFDEEGFNLYKDFYGMSSNTAMEKHYGKMADYRSSEGRSVRVPYRGPVEKTIKDILGGLRSACTYVGARRLKDLPKCTTFIRVNRQYNGIYEH